MDLGKISNLFNKQLYYDCIIKYKCTDGAGELMSHKILLSLSPYYDALFRNTQINITDIVLQNNMVLYTYYVEMPIQKNTFMTIIKMLHNNYPIQIYNYFDLISGLYFLCFDDDIIHNIINSFMKILTDEKSYDNQIQFIYQYCDTSAIQIDKKTGFIARYYYILEETDAEDFKQTYADIFPQYYLDNKMYIDDKKIHMVGTFDVSGLTKSNQIEASYDSIKMIANVKYDHDSENKWHYCINLFGILKDDVLDNSSTKYLRTHYEQCATFDMKIRLKLYDGYVQKDYKFGFWDGDTYTFPSIYYSDKFERYPHKHRIYIDEFVGKNIAYEIDIIVVDSYISSRCR